MNKSTAIDDVIADFDFSFIGTLESHAYFGQSNSISATAAI
jgi:hypothetical protein